MFLTSPVIKDSEKSTFVFQSCVRNARRSWRAEYFCRISCTTNIHVERNRSQPALSANNAEGRKEGSSHGARRPPTNATNSLRDRRRNAFEVRYRSRASYGTCMRTHARTLSSFPVLFRTHAGTCSPLCISLYPVWTSVVPYALSARC